MVGLLERNGWNVIRVLDPTFPTFWLARRAYLLLRRVGGASFGLEDQVPPSGTDMERSLRSPRHVAWNPTGAIPRLIATDLVPWDLMRRFDVYFESVAVRGGRAPGRRPRRPAARRDVITLFHVIEHAPSLARTLEQVDRLLLPGGFLVLEYPNGRSC